MARSVTRSRTAALLAAAALTVTLAACGEDPAPAPAEEPTTATGTEEPTGAETTSAEQTEEPAAAEPAVVTWDHPEAEGYTLSENPPTETVVQLENSTLACVIQLTHEIIPDAGIDDSTYTDTAIENATGALGESTETGREDVTLNTDAGAMDAREVSLTVTAGEAQMDVKMLLRAASADQVLVGIVNICPAGTLDEAAWDTFVSGTTLHGTTATSF
ncbi:hypothetical protein [Georgenia subflava]|uniref:Lipoprotein n=1 Tax=Georgenia subflava TaxID=1622177 RepID=A0A6N7EN14_9MICO|nr:hypothetical protein [Georgenia subflava]MPV38257.1 hypothetical protein [Georgenia subflava]